MLYRFLFLIFIFTSCKGQIQSTDNSNALVGGPCQGCEAINEYGQRELNWQDTLPDFETTDPKLRVEGIVYNKDGKTPAADVVVYIYHTNRQGIYEPRPNAAGWGKTHGKYRGWVKTDKVGRYSFLTFRPAPYPNTQNPEHIHFTVKEPGLREYYIDSIHFDDDPLLTDSVRSRFGNRGGNGICTPVLEEGMLYVKRDIILGMNIPNYD